MTYAPGARYTVSLSAVGTSPTTLSAKVWPTAAGPAQAWHLEATDTTAALQAPGTVSIKVAVSSVSTNPTTRVVRRRQGGARAVGPASRTSAGAPGPRPGAPACSGEPTGTVLPRSGSVYGVAIATPSMMTVADTE